MSRIVAPIINLAPGSAEPGSRRTPRRRSIRGFTLIELLVIISIIGLLVAILLPVTSAVLRAVEVNRMQASLAGLRAAAEEYRAATGGVVNHTVNRFPSAPSFDVVANDSANNNTIQLFVFEGGKVPNVAAILVASARDELQQVMPPSTTPTPLTDLGAVTDPSSIVLLDIFGNQIRYAAFVNKDDAFRDDDYLPAHPNPFFASAGPDGLWGTVNRAGVPDEEAEDNLYSFDDL